MRSGSNYNNYGRGEAVGGLANRGDSHLLSTPQYIAYFSALAFIVNPHFTAFPLRSPHLPCEALKFGNVRNTMHIHVFTRLQKQWLN